MANKEWLKAVLHNFLLIYGVLGVVSMASINEALFYIGFIVVMYHFITMYIEIFKIIREETKKNEN